MTTASDDQDKYVSSEVGGGRFEDSDEDFNEDETSLSHNQSSTRSSMREGGSLIFMRS